MIMHETIEKIIDLVNKTNESMLYELSDILCKDDKLTDAEYDGIMFYVTDLVPDLKPEDIESIPEVVNEVIQEG